MSVIICQFDQLCHGDYNEAQMPKSKKRVIAAYKLVCPSAADNCIC